MCHLRCEYSQRVLLPPAPKTKTVRAGAATHTVFEWEGGMKVVREHELLRALVTAYADRRTSVWMSTAASGLVSEV